MSHYGYVSEQLLTGELFPTQESRRRTSGLAPEATRAASRRRGFDVDRMRSHFDFPATGRVVTNNAATTQTPRELVDLYRRLSPWYESVHRGQSAASQQMTARFEESFDTIATWINAPSPRTIATYRNTTEAINAVMYSLLTEFRDGDNVVTTLMEHNSNFVPWFALCHDVLPRFGRTVECRVVRFDPETGELDLAHLAELVDERTKIVCVSGASNFLGTRPPMGRIRAIADAGGYPQPTGQSGSLLLVDAAQLAPSTAHRRRGLAGGLPGVLLPQGAGAVRGRRPLRPRAAAGALAPVPVRRRHGRRGRGDAGRTWSTARCPGSSPPGRPTSSGWSRARRRSGCWPTSRSTTGRHRGSRGRRRWPGRTWRRRWAWSTTTCTPSPTGRWSGPRRSRASGSTGRPEACHAHRCWRSRSRAPIPARSRPPWTGAASRRGPAATAPASPTATSAWSDRAPVA